MTALSQAEIAIINRTEGCPRCHRRQRLDCDATILPTRAFCRGCQTSYDLVINSTGVVEGTMRPRGQQGFNIQKPMSVQDIVSIRIAEEGIQRGGLPASMVASLASNLRSGQRQTDEQVQEKATQRVLSKPIGRELPPRTVEGPMRSRRRIIKD